MWAWGYTQHTIASGLLLTPWCGRSCLGEQGQAGEVPAHQQHVEPHGQLLTSIVPCLFCSYLTPNSYICGVGSFSADDSLGLLSVILQTDVESFVSAFSFREDMGPGGN